MPCRCSKPRGVDVTDPVMDPVTDPVHRAAGSPSHPIPRWDGIASRWDCPSREMDPSWWDGIGWRALEEGSAGPPRTRGSEDQTLSTSSQPDPTLDEVDPVDGLRRGIRWGVGMDMWTGSGHRDGGGVRCGRRCGCECG